MGKVINPKQYRGQILGGVLMAIGATLSEELIFDEKGVIENPHYFKYKLPTIKDIPKLSTVDALENPGEVGPFGARGVGEHPVIGVAPSILNAIYDAIGVDFYEIPVTPDKIKAVLKEANS
jgi:carbon-monoxide dehydrogenase large subunit